MGKAATLFNGEVDQTLIKRISPTPEQIDFLQEKWNELADHLKRELAAKHGYPVSSWLQGSYKFRTLIKPVRTGEEYDVDVGIYFAWEDEDAEPTPRQLRDWVQAEIVAFAQGRDDIREVAKPPKERCSRVSYIRQFHIDTPVYHLNRTTDARRLACYSNKFEDSDPKAIYKWFRDVVEFDKEQLRRLVRYLKAWAAICFEAAPESRPSSILLTVVAAQAYEDMLGNRIMGIADDDALIMIIQKVHDRLFASRKVPNPVAAGEDLNRMSNEAWEGFLPRLQALRDIADRAKQADDEAAAALIWSEAFSFLMPLPEAIGQVEMVEESSGRAVMQVPEIEINEYVRDARGANGRRFVAKHHNEVLSVAKESELDFRIVNPHVVPEYATVEWTVRNEGEEADDVSDLGHSRSQIRMMEAKEHTRYAGRHFMDCVVRLNGTIYAVRRVPVTVVDAARPVRNPPRPAYTTLRKFIKPRRY